MQMYPAYRLADVMREKASVFFTLLDEGYRNKVNEYMMLAAISRLASVDDESYQTFLSHLQIASFDPRDILDPDHGSNGSIDFLREFL